MQNVGICFGHAVPCHWLLLSHLIYFVRIYICLKSLYESHGRVLVSDVLCTASMCLHISVSLC